MPGLLSVARDLNTSMEAVNGTVSAYVVFMGVAVSLYNSIPLYMKFAHVDDYY